MLSFKGIILKYLFKKSRVRYCAGALGHIGANVEISRSSVIVLPGAMTMSLTYNADTEGIVLAATDMIYELVLSHQ